METILAVPVDSTLRKLPFLLSGMLGAGGSTVLNPIRIPLFTSGRLHASSSRNSPSSPEITLAVPVDSTLRKLPFLLSGMLDIVFNGVSGDQLSGHFFSLHIVSLIAVLKGTGPNQLARAQELCESREVAVLGSPPLTVPTVSVDVKQH